MEADSHLEIDGIMAWLINTYQSRNHCMISLPIHKIKGTVSLREAPSLSLTWIFEAHLFVVFVFTISFALMVSIALEG
jgi:hypothetical protein